MTASQIERYANRGGEGSGQSTLAAGDFNTHAELLFNVLPAFLTDVGDVRWKRKHGTFTLVPNTQTYNLPNNFLRMWKVFAPTTGAATFNRLELPYIGEDPLKVARAEQATTPGTPSGYYIVQNASGEWKTLKLDIPANQTATLPYSYESYAVVADPDSDVQLNQYLPEPLQWGLVEGLRAEIMRDRFGIGDAGFQVAAAKRQEWVVRARDYKELGSRNFASFVS